MKALVILLFACVIFGASGYYAYDLFIKPKRELEAEKAAPPTPAPPDATLPDFNKCVALKRQGKLVEARTAFVDFLDRFPESTMLEQARNELGEVNSRIFLTPIPSPEKQVYIVKSGDVISRVARQNKSTPELIMRANNLSSSMLRIGQKLYLPPVKFSLLLSRRQNKLIVTNDGRFFKQYPILQWPEQIPPYKRGQIRAKQIGKVTERIAWYNGGRVIFTDKGFNEATHWIANTIKHSTLYAQPPPGADPKKYNIPTTGIAVPQQATAELAAMLVRGTPITLD